MDGNGDPIPAGPTPAGPASAPKTNLRAALNTRSYAPQPAPASPSVEAALLAAPETVQYELVTDLAALDRWIDEALEVGTLAVDTETDGLTPVSANLVGISLCIHPGRACYIPLRHIDPATPREGAGGLDLGHAPPPPAQIPLADALARLKPLLEDPSVLKVGHNIKFDWQIFFQHGIAVAPIDDTMLISYVLATG